MQTCSEGGKLQLMNLIVHYSSLYTHDTPWWEVPTNELNSTLFFSLHTCYTYKGVRGSSRGCIVVIAHAFKM